MDIKLFDKVRTKDGRTASIVEVMSQTMFVADYDIKDDRGKTVDWDTDFLRIEDIEKRI